MKTRRGRSHLLIAIACGSLCSITLGCGEDRTSSDAVTEERLRQLASAYLNFAVARGAGPTNEQSLRQNLQALLPFGGEGAPADKNCFLSERDGQPFMIRYGIAVSQEPGAKARLIAFEAKGVTGTRFVARANGHVESLTEEQLNNELNH
jgi:hypothetical protein